MPKKFTIDDFKSNMKSFARPNLFEVTIDKPAKLISDDEVTRRLIFSCYSAVMPGMTTATTDKDEGYRSIAYQKIYEDVNLGFYLNGDMKELKFFQDWMKLMIQPEDNHVGYYDDYRAAVTIKNLDRKLDKVLTTKLIDAYPKGIAAMTLDQGTNDDIMKLDVTFTYRYYAQTYGNQEEVGRPNSSLIQGLGDNTETSAEDVPQDLSSVIKKTGNAVFDSIGNGSSGSFG